MFLHVCNGSEPTNVLKVFSDVDSVIDLFCSIIPSKFNCFVTKYEFAFLRCFCEPSNIERKKILRKLQQLEGRGEKHTAQ